MGGFNKCQWNTEPESSVWKPTFKTVGKSRRKDKFLTAYYQSKLPQESINKLNSCTRSNEFETKIGSQ